MVRGGGKGGSHSTARRTSHGEQQLSPTTGGQSSMTAGASSQRGVDKGSNHLIGGVLLGCWVIGCVGEGTWRRHLATPAPHHCQWCGSAQACRPDGALCRGLLRLLSHRLLSHRLRRHWRIINHRLISGGGSGGLRIRLLGRSRLLHAGRPEGEVCKAHVSSSSGSSGQAPQPKQTPPGSAGHCRRAPLLRTPPTSRTSVLAEVSAEESVSAAGVSVEESVSAAGVSVDPSAAGSSAAGSSAAGWSPAGWSAAGFLVSWMVCSPSTVAGVSVLVACGRRSGAGHGVFSAIQQQQHGQQR